MTQSLSMRERHHHRTDHPEVDLTMQRAQKRWQACRRTPLRQAAYPQPAQHMPNPIAGPPLLPRHSSAPPLACMLILTVLSKIQQLPHLQDSANMSHAGHAHNAILRTNSSAHWMIACYCPGDTHTGTSLVSPAGSSGSKPQCIHRQLTLLRMLETMWGPL